MTTPPEAEHSRKSHVPQEPPRPLLSSCATLHPAFQRSEGISRTYGMLRRTCPTRPGCHAMEARMHRSGRGVYHASAYKTRINSPLTSNHSSVGSECCKIRHIDCGVILLGLHRRMSAEVYQPPRAGSDIGLQVTCSFIIKRKD